ncbi:hypothetical protein ACFQYP_46410 [Nonomuraea antimicrobica]
MNARTSVGGRGTGSSKPPSRKLSPSRSYGSASATRAGSISMPTTSTPGATRRRRVNSSSVVVCEAP